MGYWPWWRHAGRWGRTARPHSYWEFDEEKREYHVTVELPGTSKDQLSIKASDHEIRLSAGKSAGTDQDIRKTFEFKYKITPGKIRASFSNGLLSMTVPIEETPASDVPIN
ncbi:MAG TPA: Hsp20/alpha crystallin family protein [Candidatus Hodarchaeales archaeon]|nr:Hsp20/alpha crystallin family protein [Candidatus Hodarchaeales archaeon]